MNERAAAMAARIDATTERLGIDPPGRALIARAFRTAMGPRIDARLDDHHPDFLHPARTILILMDDAAIADPDTLAGAALLETRDPALRATLPQIQELGETVLMVARGVADRGEAERLLEDLVTAKDGVRLAAVAERLDHARHLHLRPREEWAPYHAVTRAAFAPAAARAHPRLEQRLTWWCRTFADRFLRED